MKKTTIYFVRHGESIGQHSIIRGRMKGFPLTKSGRKQAGKVAGFLANKKISAVYSSPLDRAMQTAEEIAKVHKLKVRKDNRLNEWNTKKFEGKTWLQIGPIFYYNWFHRPNKIPGAERLEDVYKRMNKFLYFILRKYGGKSIVAVSHKSGINALKLGLKKKSLNNCNMEKCVCGSVMKFQFNGRKLKSIDYILP